MGLAWIDKFFFPLVQCTPYKDNTVLAKLAACLGGLLLQAENAPSRLRMAEEMLRFAESILYHEDAMVRKSLYCCIRIACGTELSEIYVRGLAFLQTLLEKETDPGLKTFLQGFLPSKLVPSATFYATSTL